MLSMQTLYLSVPGCVIELQVQIPTMSLETRAQCSTLLTEGTRGTGGWGESLVHGESLTGLLAMAQLSPSPATEPGVFCSNAIKHQCWQNPLLL